MKNITQFTTIALMALSLGYSALSAQMMHGDKARGHSSNTIAPLLSKLELSEVQRKELQSLSKTFKEERCNSEKVGNKERDLADAISKNGLDVDKLTQKLKEKQMIHIQIHTQHLRQIIAVLNEAQRLELKNILITKAENPPLRGLGY